MNTYRKTSTSRNKKVFTALPRALAFVAAAALSACAVDATTAPEDLETITEGVSTSDGDAIVSNLACSPQANMALDVICDMPGANCITRTCSATQTKFEVYTGVTNLPPTKVDGKTNGYGARGRKISEAGLCLLQDLATHPAPALTASSGDFKATQRVGFASYDKATSTVKTWRQLEVCAPIFGCVNPPTQSITVSLVSAPSVGGKKIGDFPVKRSYALSIDADAQDQATSVLLPSLPIQTPIGTVEVTPSASYYAKQPTIAGSKTFTELYVRGVSPEVVAYEEWKAGDTAGRTTGEAREAILASKPLFSSGWVSQMSFGTRGAENVWTPVTGQASKNHGRPDLELDRARSATEQAESATLTAAAEVSFDPTSILPSFMKSNPLKITNARVWVRPVMHGDYTAQLDIFASETTSPSSDVGDARRSMSQILFPTAVTSSGTVELMAGLDLKIKLDLGIASKTLLDVHLSTGVPLASWDTKMASRTAGTSIRLGGEAPAVKNAVSPTGFGYKYVDEGTYEKMTSFAGTTVGNPQGLVDQCLAKESATGTVPEPAFTPGDESDIQDVIEFPCNVCVDLEDYAGSTYTDPVSIIPSTSNPMATPKQWSCDKRAAELGCMDLCRFDPNTQALTVAHSAVDIASFECRATNRVY